MYAIAAYGVQCLAAGCWGSGAGQHIVRPGIGMLYDSCSIPLPGRTPGHLARDPQQPAAKHCTP